MSWPTRRSISVASIITTTKGTNPITGVATAGGITKSTTTVTMGITTATAIDFCYLLSVFARARMNIALCGAPYGDCL